MKYTLLLIACLCFGSAMAQKQHADFDSRIIGISNKPERPAYIGMDQYFVPFESDTVSVYMLTTLKIFGDNPITPYIRQQKGFSVSTPNSLRVKYLDLNKQPLSDIVIVWMSTPRKEECTCK